MSSGKSTILNALLGKNYIPSSSLACTAKIISVENDVTQNEIFGSRLMKSGQIFCGKLENPKMLSDWNADTKIIQIYLATQFHKLNCCLTIHDTPGTNYSMDSEHKKITQDFLSQYPLDLVICVINAEHSGTTDENELLVWLKENIVDKREIEVIFLVNKVDSIDFEREDITEIIDGARKSLIKLGYNKPLLIPISSKAALIFRMALSGEKLTEFEKITFDSLYDYFMADEFNLKDCLELKENNNISGYVNIDDKRYKKINIDYAIQKTGICVLEEILEEMSLKNENVTDHKSKEGGNLVRKVYLEYNPFLVKTKLTIDGKPISDKGALASKSRIYHSGARRLPPLRWEMNRAK